METVDMKLLKCEIIALSECIKSLKDKVITYEAKLETLKERKKSIELYNKKS
jgi:predicted DNA-binding protein YlxM (UPF0122 family)